jgi:hypothetical protein
MALTTLIDRVTAVFPKGVNAIELIHEVEIQVDNNIAMVWSPFRAVLGGTLQSYEIYIATPVKMDGRWLISGYGESCRREGGVGMELVIRGMESDLMQLGLSYWVSTLLLAILLYSF